MTEPRRPQGLSLAEAFEYLKRDAVPNGDCLEWGHARNPRGYGKLKHDGRTIDAHKAAYIAAHGVVPDGQVVRHRCDNPPCVNVAHLLSGAPIDNSRDAVERGRIRRGDQHHNVKLTDAAVVEIRERYAAGGVLQRELAAEFDIVPNTVHRIVTRKVRVSA